MIYILLLVQLYTHVHVVGLGYYFSSQQLPSTIHVIIVRDYFPQCVAGLAPMIYSSHDQHQGGRHLPMKYLAGLAPRVCSDAFLPAQLGGQCSERPCAASGLCSIGAAVAVLASRVHSSSAVVSSTSFMA